MSEIRLSSEKRLRLFTGRAFPELAQEVGDELGIPLTPTSAYDFANGEIFVRFEESVRGCDAFVLQSHATPVISTSWSNSSWLMRLSVHLQRELR